MLSLLVVVSEMHINKSVYIHNLRRFSKLVIGHYNLNGSNIDDQLS